MNFLAHIYLSFNDDNLTIGNFIADSIRGNKYLHLPEEIQKGILLHRAIDSFTDAHPTFRKSTKRLHPNYSHYSGVIVDIYYDHFLAKNWSGYCDIPLVDYTENFYALLENNYSILPERVQHMMPYMVSDNWIYNYSKLKGISTALTNINRRTKYKSNMHLAIGDLEEHYADFEAEFTSFFEELITFSKQKHHSLRNGKSVF